MSGSWRRNWRATSRCTSGTTCAQDSPREARRRRSQLAAYADDRRVPYTGGFPMLQTYGKPALRQRSAEEPGFTLIAVVTPRSESGRTAIFRRHAVLCPRYRSRSGALTSLLKARRRPAETAAAVVADFLDCQGEQSLRKGRGSRHRFYKYTAGELPKEYAAQAHRLFLYDLGTPAAAAARRAGRRTSGANRVVVVSQRFGTESGLHTQAIGRAINLSGRVTRLE